VHPLAELPLPEVASEALLDLCLQAEPALALMLPARPEPLVEAPEPAAEPNAPADVEPPLARVLTLAAMSELLVTGPEAEASPGPSPELTQQAQAAPALALPRLPEPLVEMPGPLAEPMPHLMPDLMSGSVPMSAPTPAPSAPALTSLADAQATPLPRSRALVPARRQGLVDVIAFMLRDSGRRLARWSARRHKSRAEQAALRQAQARQLNLQRELEALEALRRKRS
jgi:hypothetical protein